jgi:hypothetical protein
MVLLAGSSGLQVGPNISDVDPGRYRGLCSAAKALRAELVAIDIEI